MVRAADRALAGLSAEGAWDINPVSQQRRNMNRPAVTEWARNPVSRLRAKCLFGFLQQ